MNKLKIMLLCLLTVFILAGCSTNPEGSYGPSWDLPLRIPLLEEESESMADILEDEDDFELEDEEIIVFSYNEELEDFTLGEEIDLSDEEFDFDTTIELTELDEGIEELGEEFKIKDSFEMGDMVSESMSTSFTTSPDDLELSDIKVNESAEVDFAEDEDLDNALGDVQDLSGSDTYTLDADEIDEVDLDEVDIVQNIGGGELELPEDDITGAFDDLGGSIDAPTPDKAENDIRTKLNEEEIIDLSKSDVPIDGDLSDKGYGVDFEDLTEFSELTFDSGTIEVVVTNSTETTVKQLELILYDGQREKEIATNQLDGDLPKNESETLDLVLDGETIKGDPGDLKLNLGYVETEEAPDGELGIYTEVAEEDPIVIQAVTLTDPLQVDSSGEEDFDNIVNLAEETDNIEEVEFSGGKLMVNFDGGELGLADEDLKLTDEGDNVVFTEGENLLEDLEDGTLDFTEELTIDFSANVGRYVKDQEVEISIKLEEPKIERVDLESPENINVEQDLEGLPKELEDLNWVEFGSGDLNIEFTVLDQDGNEIDNEALGLDHSFTLTFAGAEDNGTEFTEENQRLSDKGEIEFDEITIDYDGSLETYLADADEIEVEVGFNQAVVDRAELSEGIDIEVGDDIGLSDLPALPEDVDFVTLSEGALELEIDISVDLDEELDINENSFTIKLDEEEIGFSYDRQEEGADVYTSEEKNIYGGEELSIDFGASVDTYIKDESIEISFGVAGNKLDIQRVNLVDDQVTEIVEETVTINELNDYDGQVEAVIFESGLFEITELGNEELDLDYKVNSLKIGGKELEKENGSYSLAGEEVQLDEDENISFTAEFAINAFNYLDQDQVEVDVGAELTELDWKEVSIKDYGISDLELDIFDDDDAEDVNSVTFDQGSELIIDLDFTQDGEDVSLDDYKVEIILEDGDIDSVSKNLDGEEIVITQEDDGSKTISLASKSVSPGLDIAEVKFSGGYQKGTDIKVEVEFDGSVSEIDFEGTYSIEESMSLSLADLPEEISEINLIGGVLEIDIGYKDMEQDFESIDFYLEIDEEKVYLQKNANIEDGKVILPFDDEDNSLILSKGNGDWTELDIRFEAELGRFEDAGEDITLDTKLAEDLVIGEIHFEEDAFDDQFDFSLEEELEGEEYADDLKSLALEAGTLELRIDEGGLEEIENLEFELYIGEMGVEDDELEYEFKEENGVNIYTFDLEDETIELADKIGLKNISLDYLNIGDAEEKREPLQIAGELSGLVWEEITVATEGAIEDELEEFELEERMDINLKEEIDDQELYEELLKLKSSEDAEFTLELELGGLEDIELDLDEVKIKGYDQNDESIGEVDVEDNDYDFTVDGSLINLLLNDQLAYLQLEGDIGLADGSSREVIIKAEDEIEVGLDLHLPLDFELTDPIEYKTDPEPIDPELDQDDIDLIKQGVESARLKAGLDNNLPLGVEVEFYVASTSDKEELYDSDPVATKLDIEARKDYEEFEIPFETADADRFTEDNLYVGVKITINDDEDDKLKFRSDDDIEIREAYVVLTIKVN